MKFAKIGSVLYVLWGMLHLVAAYQEFFLGASLDPGPVKGKINQGAWDLLFIASASIVIAVIYNWKNEALGYWLNLLIVSIADIGFIIFVLAPRHVALIPGILGPLLWVLALVFSTIGISSKSTE